MIEYAYAMAAAALKSSASCQQKMKYRVNPASRHTPKFLLAIRLILLRSVIEDSIGSVLAEYNDLSLQISQKRLVAGEPSNLGEKFEYY